MYFRVILKIKSESPCCRPNFVPISEKTPGKFFLNVQAYCCCIDLEVWSVPWEQLILCVYACISVFSVRKYMQAYISLSPLPKRFENYIQCNLDAQCYSQVHNEMNIYIFIYLPQLCTVYNRGENMDYKRKDFNKCLKIT